MPYDENLAQRIRDNIQSFPGTTEKKMFGGIAFLLNGNMACGVNGANMIVRIDPAENESTLALPHVRAFDMTGKPMKGWIVVEPEAIGSVKELKSWIAKGIEFAGSLPAK